MNPKSLQGERRSPTALAIAAGLALCCLASAVSAAGDRRSIDEAAVVATRYAKALGCAVVLDRRNIVPFTIEGHSLHVVVYSMDQGCSGGSAMSRASFAALEASAMGGFYVRAEYSSPSQTSDEFPAIIDRLRVRGGRLRFEGRTLGPNDALCCASLRVEGLVVFRDGRWMIDGRSGASQGE